MSTDTKFEETVRNLLQMKPKPHDEATDKQEKGRDKPAPSASEKPTSSSKESAS